MEADGSLQVKLSNQATVVPHVNLVVAVLGCDQLNRELWHPEIFSNRNWILKMNIHMKLNLTILNSRYYRVPAPSQDQFSGSFRN